MRPPRSLLQGLPILCLGLLSLSPVYSEGRGHSLSDDKFRQMDELWPTPGPTRTASGAPGHAYWQQRVNYEIDVQLDDEKQRLSGRETIRYQNNSPDNLSYLWLQLDANIYAPDSDAQILRTAPDLSRMSFEEMDRMRIRELFDGGCKIGAVKDAAGAALPFTIVKTMMRVDLPRPLAPGSIFQFEVQWSYAINESRFVGGRTGFERFEKDGNNIYEMAQWFPRLCAYTDATGWQHKQFLGRGEFTLEFGDYLVRITAPEDHIVAATGLLQNPNEVLTETQRKRLNEAQTAKAPMFIVTPDEAKANEASRAKGLKTWIYQGLNVRDFAWASSRKFIWDAQGHRVDGQTTMAMSYYPKEAEPLWSQYSTAAIVHTLNIYSRYTFAYPYPVAISVNGPVYGMEYPMICFNGPRPEEDGTYPKWTKYGLISVIIHEVGHNYFPMIVNSDERQWTWMDEGLNTFLQYLAEVEWEENYPSRRGEPRHIVGYMSSRDQVPIMTNSESILQFGPNGYAKPATALNVLRETVLGRELFDFAFREYARRWKFKHPRPADFFRTMEDASGVDLDWFWRGWFYTTEACDMALTKVEAWELESGDPDKDKPKLKAEREAEPESLSQARNRNLKKVLDSNESLKDFYNSFDELDVTEADRRAWRDLKGRLSKEDKALLAAQKHFTIAEVENKGGLIMPLIFELQFEDGTKAEYRLPAEIWRQHPRSIRKLFITEKKVQRVVLDPHLETADIDLSNNSFPQSIPKSRFKLFKEGKGRGGDRGGNPMREARKEEKRAAEKARSKLY